MTTYLTKQQDGKTYHFRITIANNGYKVIEGQFYKWVSKCFHGIGKHIDQATITDRQYVETEVQKLIDEKINNGFVKTHFTETKENTYDIYDKAKYHSGGNFPEELDHFQGCVHTGMFINWLIDNDLMDNEFFEDSQDEINKVRQRECTGAQFYENQLDCVFSIEEVSELGNRFALDYFDFDSGQYLKDYEKTLGYNLPTLYHVEDNWNNYEMISAVIDERFSEWKNKISKKPWWKIW
jgi:hypothetical protein